MKPATLVTLFAGTQIILLLYAFIQSPAQDEYSGITVHLAGDSTMSEKMATKRPDTGWGEPLSTMLCSGARLINHAKNGRSTKSFLSEGLWKNLLAKLQQGDIVLIQFGHNDQKFKDPRLFASARHEYKKNLQGFVSDARAKGAVPVLLTSIVRRSFDSQGKLQHTLGDYPTVTREVAADMAVLLVDPNSITHELIASMGPEASKKLFIHLAPGINPNYTLGAQDDTHLNFQGALEVAKMVTIKLKEPLPSVFCPAL